jgi:(p)ppGpp synthase/HD superfamily hydrolase
MKYEISNLSKALVMAAKAHAGQVDKSGEPYILHPLRVAFNYGLVGDEIVVGLLHDVLEDTDVSSDEILQEFGEEIMLAVESVSRGYTNPQSGHMVFKPRNDYTKEVYVDFIRRAGKNRIGRKVKIADLKDNLTPARLAALPESEQGISKRYENALRILEKGE